MIDIINGYGFKRNFDNTVFYSLGNIASILSVQPYLVKEHYFHCVADRCFSEGEFHKEEVFNNTIEVYIPCASFGYLIDSMVYEKIITEEQSKDAMRVLEKHIETQNIVSDCFSDFCYNYSDPIRKINPTIPNLSESISKHKD